ncbi:hypothetical protein J0X12_07630 [Sneathiella sp. CAU 1612]|uniref:Uncharacterized protein n=1 Tax=Sneathiella sedimenti TaxID=2816034 RepID=A0ABS3F4S0_9PROT|nr:hypothetical protein [Sneathiella sedimenti]MBO0333478.1 hypothetical protein [Sneathiella sedimenti]
MKGQLISSGSFANINHETWKYNGEHIHVMKVTGPINRAHRVPFYYLTLKTNPSSDYFIILDNQRGHEDDFSYDDMITISDILLEAGIKRIYGAIITRESGYENILKLARAVAKLKTLESHTVYCENMTEAENYIHARIEIAIKNR